MSELGFDIFFDNFSIGCSSIDNTGAKTNTTYMKKLIGAILIFAGLCSFMTVGTEKADTYVTRVPKQKKSAQYNGSITLVNGNLSLLVNDRNIPLGNLPVYKFENCNANSSMYYQIDVTASDCLLSFLLTNENRGFIAQGIIKDGQDAPYSFIASLDESEISFVDGISTVSPNDSVLETLAGQSNRYYDFLYASSEEKTIMATSSYYAHSGNNLCGSNKKTAEILSRTDNIIHSYVSSFYGKFMLPNGLQTDDPITQIIPKDAFFHKGKYAFSGEEYGFVMKNYKAPFEGEYYNEVMVFDIDKSLPSFPSNPRMEIDIVPLFQYRYFSMPIDDPKGDGYDPSLSAAVRPTVNQNMGKLCLTNFGCRYDVFNPTLLSAGDNGYVASNDNGAFIIQSRGRIIGENPGDCTNTINATTGFLHDTIAFAFGFVPYVGPVLSTFEYVRGVYLGLAENQYLYKEVGAPNEQEVMVNTLETNSFDQISVRGNLTKTSSINFISAGSGNATNSLVGTGGYKYQTEILLSRKGGSKINDIGLSTSFSFDFLQVTKVIGQKNKMEILGIYSNSRFLNAKLENSFGDPFDGGSAINRSFKDQYQNLTIPYGGRYRFIYFCKSDVLITVYRKKDGSLVDGHHSTNPAGTLKYIDFDLNQNESYSVCYSGGNEGDLINLTIQVSEDISNFSHLLTGFQMHLHCSDKLFAGKLSVYSSRWYNITLSCSYPVELIVMDSLYSIKCRISLVNETTKTSSASFTEDQDYYFFVGSHRAQTTTDFVLYVSEKEQDVRLIHGKNE